MRDALCLCGNIVERNGVAVRGHLTYEDGTTVCLAAGTKCHDARIDRDHSER